MRFLILAFSCLPVLSMAQTDPSDYLYRVCDEEEENCGYVNQEGDTVIPLKYYPCFTDTLKEFAIVNDYEVKGGFPAIDRHDNVLFVVYPFDNGPDYVEEGLFRIIDNDLIGFANMQGEIVIKPQFQCAFMFIDGKAQVAFIGRKESVPESEHWSWISNEWFFIDHDGNRVEGN
ncbi:MAG: hypothetical protein ACI837_000113 [Crocinitomicaceae bacterium]|jgi:hypothetical protein